MRPYLVYSARYDPKQKIETQRGWGGNTIFYFWKYDLNSLSQRGAAAHTPQQHSQPPSPLEQRYRAKFRHHTRENQPPAPSKNDPQLLEPHLCPSIFAPHSAAQRALSPSLPTPGRLPSEESESPTRPTAQPNNTALHCFGPDTSGALWSHQLRKRNGELPF